MIEEKEYTLADALDFDGRVAEPLRERLRQVAEEWRLPVERLRTSAIGQVMDRVRQVFGTPLYRVLAAAWRRHPSCRAFCDREEYPPGESHTVELAEHTLGWECEPAVEVLADGLDAAGAGRLAELRFEVEIEAAVRGGLLTIRDAKFIQMEAAELTIGATLRLQGFTVATYKVPVPIPGTLRFGQDGEPICPGVPPANEAAPPAVAQVPVPAIVDADAAPV
ncbi:MAG TPA: hypothetical protein VHG93_18300 [Longimicrobium sp.]|nr:hypothetical protein [Longimicrobium sp.]